MVEHEHSANGVKRNHAAQSKGLFL